MPKINGSFPLNSTKINNDFYDLRSLLKRAFSFLNQKIRFGEGKENVLFHGQNLLNIFDSEGVKLGSMGYMKQRSLDLNVLGVVARLPWRSFGGYRVPDFSEFPVSMKDISIEVTDLDLEIGEIMSRLEGKNLRKVDLLEKYEDGSMVSYLLRFRFQSDVGTLTKADIDGSMEEIYSCLKKLNVKIR